MAENSAELTEPGQGSNTDTRQLSIESLKDAILKSLSRFSDNLVSVLDIKLTQIHEQVAVKFTDRQMDELHEDTRRTKTREPPAKRARTTEAVVSNMPASGKEFRRSFL